MEGFPKPWKQGEHIVIIGDTGTGKTQLLAGTARYPGLLLLRDYVIAIRTKSDPLAFPGFTTVKTLKGIRKPEPGRPMRILLQPEFNLAKQRTEVVRAMNKAWDEHGWTVCVDEQFYLEDRLKLRGYSEMLLTGGRSMKISYVTGAQRFSWLSKYTVAEAEHIFIFRQHKGDLKYIRDNISSEVAAGLKEVRGHDFLYFNRSSDEMIIGNLQSLSNIIVKP